MFVKKDFIIQQIVNKDLVNCKVLASDGRSLLFEVDGNDTDAKHCAGELEDFLANQVEEGTYTVKLSTRPKGKKAEGGSWGEFTYKVKVGGGKTSNSIGGIPDAFSTEYRDLVAKNIELNTKVVRLEEEAKRKEEMNALQKQIDKLKESDPFEKYAPVINGIMGYLNRGNAVAGAAQEMAAVAGPQTKEEIVAKINSAIKRMMKIDPNFPDTITALADFAEKDPERYKSFIPMLKAL